MKESKIDALAVFKDLSQTKEHLITEKNENDYPAWFINSGFSNYQALVFFANEMNMSRVDPLLQYDFYYKSIPAKKRYSKWAKKYHATKEVEAVAVYFDYSIAKAKDVISMLKPEQMEVIMTYAENLKQINML